MFHRFNDGRELYVNMEKVLYFIGNTSNNTTTEIVLAGCDIYSRLTVNVSVQEFFQIMRQHFPNFLNSSS